MPRYYYQCKECNESFTLVKKVSESSREVNCIYCDTGYGKRLFKPPVDLSTKQEQAGTLVVEHILETREHLEDIMSDLSMEEI